MAVKYLALLMAVGALLLQGCKSDEDVPVTLAQAPQSLPGMNNEVVATIRGRPITLEDVEPVLIDGYGLNVVLLLVQKDLAQEEAARQEIVVTPEDVDKERTITLTALQRSLQSSGVDLSTTHPDDVQLTPEEADQLLDQVLTQQHMSRAEFGVLMETVRGKSAGALHRVREYERGGGRAAGFGFGEEF